MSGSPSHGAAEDNQQPAYVLGLDVGTTVITCHVYDNHANICGSSTAAVELVHPQPGWSEIEPEEIWTKVQEVIKQAILAAGLTAANITCLGISTQRNTFITWDRETGEYFHRFITWQDLRASDMVKDWNRSYTMKAFNNSSKMIHMVSRQKRFQAAAFLKFQPQQITMRLKWQLDNNFKLRRRLNCDQVQYGTLDTFLLWKMTGGKVIATDYSNASTSGMFDPYTMEWSTVLSSLLSLPLNIMPEVRDTSGVFGRCDVGIFGASIPITAMGADQQVAFFGQCCFHTGDVTCSMGTGTFIDLNTGSTPHASIAGLYPLIGWKIGEETVYVAEGLASDTGRCVEWAKSMGLCKDVSETSSIAESVPDTGGVYFVPAFSGLQAPINDDHACTTLIGIRPDTQPAHVVRAILEAIVFRCKLLYETVLKETNIPLSKICRVHGGVTKNDFVLQLVSDLTGTTVERPKHIDMSSLGAAFLAGLAAGVWTDKEEIFSLRTTEKTFTPRDTWSVYKPIIIEWERALKRTLGWYKNNKSQS